MNLYNSRNKIIKLFEDKTIEHNDFLHNPLKPEPESEQ